MSDVGFLGSFVPEEYEGAGLDVLSYVLVVEEVSRACGSTGVFVSAHSSLGCDPILRFGTEAQKQQYLPDLATGRKIGCLLLTETDAGSDPSRIATTYRREGDEFVINGSKLFVTNGADLGTGVLRSPGVVVLKNENKMGIRGTSTTAFAFDDLRLPAAGLLGEEGQGFKIAMETLNGGRIGIAAQALGIAQGAFDRALAYSKERRQFEGRLCDLQAIQFKLADMYTRIETSRLATYKAAWLKDSGADYTLASALCKVCASETATSVAREAIQIHGGYGYIVDYEVERMYRDARITEIYEGTNEVQRIVISKILLA
jgi:butyryl-CoA dehydrogenase